MAFSSTMVQRPIQGLANKRVAWGTWTGDSVDTGELDTGLTKCDVLILTPNGSAPAAQCSAEETFPCDGGAITINFTSGANGNWFAIGR